jgi:menaquinone-dependent protoporphyrinogen oxidase
MLSFLVIYGTGEGQTEKVAARLVEAIEDRGHDARAVNVRDRPSDRDVEESDAVIVGSSIHIGKHGRKVRTFVRNHRDALAAKPTAFFQVSLSSSTEEGAEEAAKYVDEFVETTGWHPDRIGLFGGALRFSKYGFIKGLMMKRIVAGSMPDVDPSTDTEFTDWDEVDAFAADVAAFVEGRLGVSPPE